MKKEKMQSVFKLAVLQTKKDEKGVIQYPVFRISPQGLGDFPSLKSAEEALSKHISEEKQSDNVYCFAIEEYAEDNLSQSGIENVRLYFPSGELKEERLLSKLKDKDFSGLPAEKIRFKKGDIVDVFRGDCIETGIVVEAPDADDTYMVLSGADWSEAEKHKSLYDRKLDNDDYDFEFYSPSIYVFAPRFPIPEELKKALTTYLEEYWLYEIEAFVTTAVSKSESNLPVIIWVDEFGIWDKYIKFQKDKSDKGDIRELIRMSIEDEPKILDENAQHDLSDDELQQIKEYVKKNKRRLLAMCKKKATNSIRHMLSMSISDNPKILNKNY
jgi:hypothetical protein